MRAIQQTELAGPEVLELTELPRPEPGDGEVLIEVCRSGINFADTHQRENTYLVPAHLPFVPGIEVAGVRVDTGERVVAVCGGGWLRRLRDSPRGADLPDPRRARILRSGRRPRVLAHAEDERSDPARRVGPRPGGGRRSGDGGDARDRGRFLRAQARAGPRVPRGNGYIEDSGLPLLLRDSPLQSIWEGPSNVIALDVLRAAAREPEAVEAFVAECGLARGRRSPARPALDEGQADARAVSYDMNVNLDSPPPPFALDPSPQAADLLARVREFMAAHVYPNETAVADALEAADPDTAYPELAVELRERAKSEGLWNLFLPDEAHGTGLSNWEYGLLCEEMGRSPILGPVAFNCAAPDTGNVEILLEHGTEEQKEYWLGPLLEGEIRSCFAMTEPEVAGSDPTAIRTRAILDGDEWIIDGHKWFTTGARGASLAIVVCVTDPDAPPHSAASMILVPTDAPGYERVRQVSVMGAEAAESEVRFSGCRVPAENLLGPRGAGVVIAQNRLGPGRIHHCMRALGVCERAIEAMCRRANERKSFGSRLADFQFIQDFVFRSRAETDQARLLTLHAARIMDSAGNTAARQEISMAKVVAANVVLDVLDRAIQVHGALGVSDDTPLAGLWRGFRFLRIADGPDEVHKMVVSRRELSRWAPRQADGAASPRAEQPAGSSSRAG
jgi:acyl-CoA dehydrogenase